MKLDAPGRQGRLPAVPEQQALLGVMGGNGDALPKRAASAKTYPAQQPPQRARAWLCIAICLLLGGVALWLLGAPPFGASPGAWILSRPKAARHNPAAALPQQPVATAELDAAVTQLEGGLPGGGAQQVSAGGGGDDGGSGGGGKSEGVEAGGGDSSSGGDSGSDNGSGSNVTGDRSSSRDGSGSGGSDADATADVAKPNNAGKAGPSGNQPETSGGGQEAAGNDVEPAKQSEPRSDKSAAGSQPSPQAAPAAGQKTRQQQRQQGSAAAGSTGGSKKATDDSSGANNEAGTADGAAAAAAHDAEPGGSSRAGKPVEAGSSKGPAAASGAPQPKVGGGSGKARQDNTGGRSRADAQDEAAMLAAADSDIREPQPFDPSDGTGSTSAAIDSNVAEVQTTSSVSSKASLVAATDSSKQQAKKGKPSSRKAAQPTPSGKAAAGKLGRKSGGDGSSGSSADAGGGKPNGKSGGGGGSRSSSAGSGRSNGKSGGNGSPSSGVSTDSSKSTGKSGRGGTPGSGAGAATAASAPTAQPAAGSKGAAGESERTGRKQAAGRRGGKPSGQGAAQKKTAAGAQESCLAFAPAGCQLIPGQLEPLEYPKCDERDGHITPGGPDCNFNLTEDLKICPLPAAGLYFERKPSKGGCSVPPFWQETGAGAPSCKADGVCCSGDGFNGTWQEVSSDKEYQSMEFVPDENTGCRFHSYTRRQVLGCLADTTVMMWGDSMLRQLFNRVPSLFRGQRRSYDAQRWRAERYDVCEAADARTMAPTIDGLAPKDFHYAGWGLAALTDDPAQLLLSLDEVPRTELLDLVDPNAEPKEFPGRTCGDTRPVSFVFVPATGFQPTHRFMGMYMDKKYGNHTDLSKAVFLTQVGFWDFESEVPPDKYLQTLQDALDRGLKRLVIVLVPTPLVGIDERDPRRGLLRGRNDFMRRWAANETSGRTSVIDFDTLSLAPNAPTGLLGNWTDWHYMCKFVWYAEEPEHNVTAAELAPRSHTWLDPGGWTLGDLNTNWPRDCIDDMNRVVLQLLFNDLCNRRD